MNRLRCYPLVVTDQSSEKEIRRGLIDVRCSRWNLGLVHAYFEPGGTEISNVLRNRDLQ